MFEDEEEEKNIVRNRLKELISLLWGCVGLGGTAVGFVGAGGVGDHHCGRSGLALGDFEQFFCDGTLHVARLICKRRVFDVLDGVGNRRLLAGGILFLGQDLWLLRF